MYEEFQNLIESLGLELALEDESVAVPEDINTLRSCIDMYDQELMVKVILILYQVVYTHISNKIENRSAFVALFVIKVSQLNSIWQEAWLYGRLNLI
jgi:hypothetical protein